MNASISSLRAATLPSGQRIRGLARPLLVLATGSLALAISAKIQVPFWPVPMTMQSLIVLLIGVAAGPRLGTAILLTYLAEGLLGLPVFAGASAGPAYILGPTGGYLVGFVLAAACVGHLAERNYVRGLAGATAAMAIGHLVLFASGVTWLAVLFGWSKAIAAGLTPFVLGTVVKIALGAALCVAYWSVNTKHRS